MNTRIPAAAALDGKLRLHESIRFETRLIGAERRPLLIVDNFLGDPQALIDHAASAATFSANIDPFYPGLRAPIPQIYTFALRAFLGSRIIETFPLGGAALTRERSHYSLVTTRPGQLVPLQRIPHFDNTDERQIALLHYLSPREQGGTSFYRHLATGFEAITPTRLTTYEQQRSSELPAVTAASYIAGSTSQYQRIASVEPRFNRLIAYQGLCLHSADIDASCSFSTDVRTGRLTANTFFVYR